jgi:hypothetical protein
MDVMNVVVLGTWEAGGWDERRERAWARGHRLFIAPGGASYVYTVEVALHPCSSECTKVLGKER